MILYGNPTVLQTENGKEFVNNILANMLKRRKVKHVKGRPYHP
jgi:hypothetical protein